jgi:hypothetical protein
MLEIHLASLGEMLEIHHAQHPPTTLNRETRRAPTPPDTSSYPVGRPPELLLKHQHQNWMLKD